MKRIYLDYASASPVDQRVLEAMQPYFSDVFYNPSALYEGARNAKTALEDARHETAKLIGAKPSEIIFTAGGTESANLAVHGVMRANPGSEIITSAVEHEAVLRPAEKYSHKIAPVDEKGRLIVGELEKLITDKTVLISVMLVNNEVGTLQPIKDVVELVVKTRIARKKAKNDLPLYLHTDACQAPLYLDVNIARLGVDLMTLNGGKIHGPKQSGVLYKRAGIVIEPLIAGGGQEWGLRSGTENVAFAVGFTKALGLADKGRNKRTKQVSELRDYLAHGIEEKLSGEISGDRKHRIANNVHAIFPGIDNERALFALDDMGVDASAGSACSASSDVSSHVLIALGKTDPQARASLRFTLGAVTTKEELAEALRLLEKALKA